MSISRTVYLRRDDLLDPKSWAEAIRAAGFPMELDADFEVETFSGFLPCRYEGKSAGFEYYFATRDAEDFGPPEIGDRDVAISFVTHSSMRELVTAVIAAATLCEKTNGILVDEESGDRIPARAALADARELIASVGPDLD